MARLNDRIHPARQVIMRLPDTDPRRDPWTGVPMAAGRNLDDETIDENVALLPPLGKTPAELNAELSEPIRPEDYLEEEAHEESDRDWVQFTLSDILVLMTAAGVALGGVRFLPGGIFALLGGVAAVLFLVIFSDGQISRPRFRNIAVGLVTFYVVAIVAVIVNTAWSA